MTRCLLSVYAAPVRLPDGLDAAYGETTWVVGAEPGVAWPCLTDAAATCDATLWATGAYRPATGRSLLTVEGEHDVAACLAGPGVESFEGLPAAAGIVYGVNGVGHQITNRILFDTSADVRDAQGAWFSWWLYGTYGTSIPGAGLLGPVFGPVGTALDRAIGAGLWLDWARRKQRCHTQRTMMDDARQMRREFEGVVAGLESGTDAAFAGLGARADEIAAMLHARLDGGTPSRVLGSVREFVEATAHDATTAIPRLDLTVYAATVAADCNASLTRHFSEVARLLGSDDYRRIFGAPPDAPITLIDADVLARFA